jgi:hypothetical protein
VIAQYSLDEYCIRTVRETSVTFIVHLIRLSLAYTVYCPMLRCEFELLFDHLLGEIEECHKTPKVLE